MTHAEQQKEITEELHRMLSDPLFGQIAREVVTAVPDYVSCDLVFKLLSKSDWVQQALYGEAHDIGNLVLEFVAARLKKPKTEIDDGKDAENNTHTAIVRKLCAVFFLKGYLTAAVVLGNIDEQQTKQRVN